jgi:methionyl-tRNA formyltransferase
MKIVFFGTPDYVIPILDSLNKAYKSKAGESPITAVVTQSPKPVGRKQLLEYSAVDSWAHKRNIPKYFNAADVIKENIQADLGVIASYGALLPNELVNFFPHGILVVHPSLLPAFRWASPIPAAIITETNPTGVTIIKMDDKFDHGPIAAQFKEEVLPEDTCDSLRDRLFAKSADVLVGMLTAYTKSKIHLKPQDDSKATYARMLTKEDAFIPPEYLAAVLQGTTLKGDWEIPFITVNKSPYILHPTSYNLYNFIRAMSPWPTAWTLLRLSPSEEAKRLKILKAHIESTLLILDEVQLEGKNPVSWKQFLEAYPKAKFV